MNAAAIGAHLIGGAGLVLAHRDRVRGQAGVTANTTVQDRPDRPRSGLHRLQRGVGRQSPKPVPLSPEPYPRRAPRSRRATTQQQLRILQWLTPALTGA